VIRSVRGRLTVAVAVAVGTITVAAALVAPKAVERTLLDDRLDAEAARETASLAIPIRIVNPRGGVIGSTELTAIFGAEIADLCERLDALDALEPIRDLRSDGMVLVAPSAGVVGTLDTSGEVVVEQIGADDLGGAVVSLDRLRELAVELESDRLTLDDVLARLDDVDGADPRQLYEALVEDLADTPARDVSGYAFGTRPVGNVEVIVTTPTDGIALTVERVRAALWLAVPIIVVLSGLATWLIAGRALRPVRLITERTRTIRSSTLHDRVPVPQANDELRGLATEMNTMLDRVQTEDARRRQFVADASHELRSPIAAIRVQAEAALAEAGTGVGTETVADLATGVLAEAERMGMLVDDLLSLARHDETLAAPGTVVDLDDIVLTEARRQRRVRIDTSKVSAGRVRCRVDELTRAVTHLLDNAARHADTSVTVGLATDDRTDSGFPGEVVRLTVDDDGPGVPVDDRERIFERFVRLDDARQRDLGGAGLGLAVVAAVAKSCGGTVEVTDSPLGGARFVLSLPAC
jgi:signal transduction histidine kinase